MPTRFRVLDSWRGVAAVLVVLYHGVFLGALNDNAFVRGGYLFVDFFFVLSGFVIAHAYGDKLSDPIGALGFMIRRFGRLWPLHVVMLLAFAAAEGLNAFLNAHSGGAEAFRLSANDNSLYSFLTNLAMLNAVGLHRSITWNGASWSIGAEFYAYVVFCLVTLFARAAAPLLAAIIAVAAAFAVFALSNHHPAMDATFDLGCLRGLYGFFVGFLVHAAFVHDRAAGESLPYATAFEVAALATAAALMTVSGEGRLGVAAPLFFAPVVFVFAHEGGAVSRLLLARPFAAIGAWSYSIYMTQGLIGNAYDRAIVMLDRRVGVFGLEKIEIAGRDFWSPNANGWAMDALTLTLVAIVVLASAFTFRWIEEPARKYFNRVAAATESRLADRRSRRLAAAGGSAVAE